MLPNNLFNRLEYLIGKDNIELLSNKTVLVIGLGGVGSYAVEALVRSGIGSIILVDYDIVDITNINRQILALNSTIGKKKVELEKERIQDINRNCKVTCYDLFLDKNNLNTIFKDKIDYVIDACDSIDTKKELIKKCLNENIKLISSMGMAKRMDPGKIEIIDIRKTKNDPLARTLRKFIKDERINKKIMVACSTELPMKCEGSLLGSTAFVPSSAGLLITSYVIRDLIDIKKD